MIDKWSMRLLLTRREENNKVFNDKTRSFPPRPTFPLALLDDTTRVSLRLVLFSILQISLSLYLKLWG